MISFSNKTRLTTSLSLSALAGMLTITQPAFAQAKPAADDASGEDTIVVTARKHEEDLLTVPLTVTALTAQALEAKGVTTMQDVASSTPGININDSSSGHADRGFQQVVLRGFTPVTTLATTTSLFIDGVPVSSPSAFTSISSPERIEILKGPQSAFFGRNTFAGAINVVNKVPGNDLSGSISGSYGTHSNQKYHADLEGAISPDTVMVRFGLDYFDKKGSWRNAGPGGGTLGDQSSLSGSALLVLKPTETITIKAFALASRDKDGAPANARLVTQDVKDGAGNVILKSQANCTFQGDTSGVAGFTGTTVTNNYICGTLPSLINPISANASNDAITRAFLYFAPNRRLIAPEKGVQGYGLLRQYRHYHISADIELTNALTASLLGGLGREFWNTMIDLDGFDGSRLTVGNPGVAATSVRGHYDFPFLVERKTRDSSMEARLAYETAAFRGVVGVSYLNATVQSGSRGSPLPLVEGNAFPNSATSPGGVSQNKTVGAFFGLTYDLTSEFSISTEGRYQVDKIIAFAPNQFSLVVPSSVLVPAGTYAPGSILAQGKFKNFTPRIIANYNFSPSAMVYASWSKGVNPSQFNSAILTSSDAIQTAAAQAGVKVVVEPEKLTNYEIGLKGKAAGGAFRYAISAYYAQWTNQINSVSLLVPTTPPQLATGVQNSGALNLKGIEFETVYKVNDFLTVDFAGALNDTSFKSFKNRFLSQLTGIYNYAGKEMPYSSKYSMNLGAQVGSEIGSWDDGKWFFRTDWSYKSGTWSGQANTTKSRARNLVNLRAGVTKGIFSVEAFVNNAFNDINPTSLIDQTLFDPSLPGGTKGNAALFVNFGDKRTAGLQLKVKF
jgi:iron complex outermembrane recepter protein